MQKKGEAFVWHGKNIPRKKPSNTEKKRLLVESQSSTIQLKIPCNGLQKGSEKMNKCAYCNERSNNLFPVAVEVDKGQWHGLGVGSGLGSLPPRQETVYCDSEECKEKTVAFYRFFKRRKTMFLGGAILALCFMFASVVIRAAWPLPLGFVLIGLDCILFPFAKPQMFAMYGIKKTILTTRIIGIFLIALAPIFWLLLET